MDNVKPDEDMQGEPDEDGRVCDEDGQNCFYPHIAPPVYELVDEYVDYYEYEPVLIEEP